METFFTTRTTNIINRVWDSPMNCITRWRGAAAGNPSSGSAPPLGSTRSPPTVTNWLSRRRQIWFYVPWSTKIESSSTSWTERWKVTANLRNADLWPIKSTCLFRVLFSTRQLTGKDVSEFTIRPFLWPIFPIYRLIIWILVRWLYTGLEWQSLDHFSIREISHQYRLS